jgi:hypothetical protein
MRSGIAKRDRLLVTAVSSLILIAAVETASGDHRRPPSAVLGIAGESQEGFPYSVSWGYRHDDQCVTQSAGSAFYPRGAPPPTRVSRGRHRVGIQIRSSVEPQISIAQYTGVKDDGSRRGDGRSLPVTVKRREANDRTRWKAMTTVRVRNRIYLDVVAVWPQRTVCAPRNRVGWSFHLASFGSG